MSRNWRDAWLWVALATAAAGCGGQGTADAPAPAPKATGLTCPSFKMAASGLPTTGEWRTHPSIGDVNEDGLGDVAALARKGTGPVVFLGDGLGGWTDGSMGLKYARAFSCGIGTRLVDLDRDGHLDLIAADHCTGVRVFKGDGGTAWTDASQGIPENMEGFNDADAGDLNGDGILDIVAVSAFSRGFLVLAGRSDQTWEVVRDTGLPANGMAFRMRLVDVTGDGRLDVVASFSPDVTDRRSPIAPPAKVWIQDSAGRFYPAQGFGDQTRVFGVATVPRDESGRRALLLAVTGARAGLYLFEPTAVDTWTEAARIDADWFEGRSDGFTAVDTADFDGDGCIDIVVTGGRVGLTKLALGNCRGEWSPCPDETLPQEHLKETGWGVTAGDLNGDGRPDVVAAFGTHSKGGLGAWIQSGAARAAGQRTQESSAP